MYEGTLNSWRIGFDLDNICSTVLESKFPPKILIIL
jgi:hypothetical protein